MTSIPPRFSQTAWTHHHGEARTSHCGEGTYRGFLSSFLRCRNRLLLIISEPVEGRSCLKISSPCIFRVLLWFCLSGHRDWCAMFCIYSTVFSFAECQLQFLRRSFFSSSSQFVLAVQSLGLLLRFRFLFLNLFILGIGYFNDVFILKEVHLWLGVSWLLTEVMKNCK